MSCSVDLNVEREAFRGIESKFGREAATQYFAASIAHYKLEGLMHLRAGVVTYKCTDSDLICDTYSWTKMHTGQIELPDASREAALRAAQMARNGQTAMYVCDEFGSNKLSINILIPNPETNEVVAHVLYFEKDGPAARYQREQLENIFGPIPPEGEVSNRKISSELIDFAVEQVTDGLATSVKDLVKKVSEMTREEAKLMKEMGIDAYISSLEKSWSKESSDLIQQVRDSFDPVSDLGIEGKLTQTTWSEVSQGRVGIAVSLREAITAQGGIEAIGVRSSSGDARSLENCESSAIDRSIPKGASENTPPNVLTPELSASPQAQTPHIGQPDAFAQSNITQAQLAIIAARAETPQSTAQLYIQSPVSARTQDSDFKEPSAQRKGLRSSLSLSPEDLSTRKNTVALMRSAVDQSRDAVKSGNPSLDRRSLNSPSLDSRSLDSRSTESARETAVLREREVAKQAQRSWPERASELKEQPVPQSPRTTRADTVASDVASNSRSREASHQNTAFQQSTLLSRWQLARNGSSRAANAGGSGNPSRTLSLARLQQRSRASDIASQRAAQRRELGAALALKSLALRSELARLRLSIRSFREAALGERLAAKGLSPTELGVRLLNQLRKAAALGQELRASVTERLRALFNVKNPDLATIASHLRRVLGPRGVLSRQPEGGPTLQDIKRLRFALRFPGEVVLDKTLSLLPRTMREALVNQLSKRVALSLRALERAREGGATSREAYTALLATTLTRLTLLRKTLLSVGRRDDAKKLSLSILQLLEELQALGLSASELQQHALAEVDWVIARASRMRSGRSRKRTALTDREGSEALRDDGTPSMVQPQGRGKARREGRTLVEGAPQTKPTLGFFQTAAVSGPKDFLETHQSIEKPLSDEAEGDQPPHRLQPLRHEAFASAP